MEGATRHVLINKGMRKSNPRYHIWTRTMSGVIQTCCRNVRVGIRSVTLISRLGETFNQHLNHLILPLCLTSFLHPHRIISSHLALTPQQIIPQHTPHQNLRPRCTILRLRKLHRIMTNPVPTRHENHSRRNSFTSIHRIMTSP